MRQLDITLEGAGSMSYKAKRTKSPYVRRKIQACRQRLEMTCEQVAKEACMSREYYIKIENGQNTPSRITMMKIAEVLHVKKWWDLFELQAVETKKEEDK